MATILEVDFECSAQKDGKLTTKKQNAPRADTKGTLRGLRHAVQDRGALYASLLWRKDDGPNIGAI